MLGAVVNVPPLAEPQAPLTTTAENLLAEQVAVVPPPEPLQFHPIEAPAVEDKVIDPEDGVPAVHNPEDITRELPV